MTITMTIDPIDRKRIDNLGLLVSMHGDSFVVRHPRLKRQRFEAGNLSSIITAAQMALTSLDEKNGKTNDTPAKLPGLKGTKNTFKPAGPGEGKTIAQAVAESPKNDPEDREEEEEAEQHENTKKQKKTRTAKPKRSQGDWKTYQVGKLILTNPDKTPDEILTMCKEKGIETKLMTVIGLARYFRLCVRIMADITEEKTQRTLVANDPTAAQAT